MKKICLVLFAALLVSPAAYAEVPTGKVYIGRGGVNGIINCYPSVYRGPDGRVYKRSVDCPGDGMKYSDIGVPLYGPAVKMPREAGRFRRLPNGNIQLY